MFLFCRCFLFLTIVSFGYAFAILTNIDLVLETEQREMHTLGLALGCGIKLVFGYFLERDSDPEGNASLQSWLAPHFSASASGQEYADKPQASLTFILFGLLPSKCAQSFSSWDFIARIIKRFCLILTSIKDILEY